MLIGGLWHGASWTFVIWGGLHGVGLVINHLWRAATSKFFPASDTGLFHKLAGWALTFFFVVHAWVFFRAADVPAARFFFSCMYGLGPAGTTEIRLKTTRVLFFLIALLIAFLCPNTQQLFARYKPVLEWRALRAQPSHWWDRVGLIWRPTPAWAFLCAIAAVVSLVLTARGEDFIYFRF